MNSYYSSLCRHTFFEHSETTKLKMEVAMGTLFIGEACLRVCACSCCPGYRVAVVWVWARNHCKCKTSDEANNGQMSFSNVFFLFSPKKPSCDNFYFLLSCCNDLLLAFWNNFAKLKRVDM